MEDSKIQWTHHTFNPWRGCTKVSAGCANCYAETLSGRNPKTLGVWGPQGTRVVASDSAWREPRKWNRVAKEAGERHRVFCASLADVFEGRETMPEASWVAVEAARVRLFHLISETPRLDWLLLTKRPENVSRFRGGDGVPRSWPENMPPNVWLGVSVEDQAAANERIPHLLKIQATVRFLSCEPLLAPVDLWSAMRPILGTGAGGAVQMDIRHGIDWVIVGGESGPRARACNPTWIVDLVDQCQAAGVACFVKQLGSNVLNFAQVKLRDSKGGDPSEWASDLRVRQFPMQGGVA